MYEAVSDWLKCTTVVGQLDYRFFGIRIHRLYIPYFTIPYLITQGRYAAAQRCLGST